MDNNINIRETKNYIAPKKKKSKARKIVLISVLVFLLGALLAIAATVYISSAHYAPSGLKYKITSSNTCKIISVGKCAEAEITVPEKIGFYTVTEIGGSAFARCDGLKKVVLPETVTKIDVSAFYESKELEEVYLPSGITEIASQMFFGCKSLKTVDLPEGIVRIGENAFEESGLTEITIGKNVKTIGSWAFAECHGLTAIKIPDTVEELAKGSLANCDSLERVVLGNGIEEIPDSLFYSALSLETVVFPKSIQYIGTGVFANGGPQVITYLGTVAEWNAVEKAEGWSRYLIVSCTDGAVDNSGNPVAEE